MNSPSELPEVSSPKPIDFTVQNEGTVFLLHPHTRAAQRWIIEHLPADRQMFGPGVVIEHRFICDILDGIRADGLSVQPEVTHDES